MIHELLWVGLLHRWLLARIVRDSVRGGIVDGGVGDRG